MNTSTYTRNVLTEKNIHLGDHLPRRFRDLNLTDFDLIVNLSGSKLPGSLATPVENWNVDDPFGGTEDDFRAARERIEMLVMNLILRVRTGKI